MTTAPRIVLLNNSRETFTPTVSGAIGTCLWEVVRAAHAVGDAPVVLTRPADADPYPWDATEFLKVPGARSGRAERAVRRLTGWAHPSQRAYAHAATARLRELRPAVVVCNNDPEIAAYLRARLPDVRVLHWFHNLELARDGWRRRFAREDVVPLAVSEYLARAVEQVYAMTPRTVAVAYNGVDAERFRPRGGTQGDRTPRGGAEADTPDPTRPVLGFLGRLAVEKGPDVFLRAALDLAERGREFDVQVLGDTNWGFYDGGPYGREVLGLIDALTAAGVSVRHPGHVPRDDVPAALRRADVHVVTSRWDEPFGLTTLEGMASGLAVVATATGGSPEVVGDAGLLVPRDDPAALADALERLLASPAELARLQHAARSRAERFPWSRTWAALAAASADGPATTRSATDDPGEARARIATGEGR